jgi:hypothetical protein
MQLYYFQLNLAQLQMVMFRIPHVEDELQAFFKLLCPSAVVFRCLRKV